MLQRDVVDAALEYVTMFDAAPGEVKAFTDVEKLHRLFGSLKESVRAMLLAAKDRGDGTP